MGIGNSKWKCVLALLLTLAAGLPGAGVESRERHGGIWDVLRAGHFTGGTSEARVRKVPGSISANGKRYSFMEYYWEGKGTGDMRLLVFEQTEHGPSYLGYYSVDFGDLGGPVHPVIRGQSVFLPYHGYDSLGAKQAFAISFADGPPPTLVPGSVIRFER